MTLRDGWRRPPTADGHEHLAERLDLGRLELEGGYQLLVGTGIAREPLSPGELLLDPTNHLVPSRRELCHPGVDGWQMSARVVENARGRPPRVPWRSRAHTGPAVRAPLQRSCDRAPPNRFRERSSGPACCPGSHGTGENPRRCRPGYHGTIDALNNQGRRLGARYRQTSGLLVPKDGLSAPVALLLEARTPLQVLPRIVLNRMLEEEQRCVGPTAASGFTAGASRGPFGALLSTSWPGLREPV